MAITFNELLGAEAQRNITSMQQTIIQQQQYFPPDKLLYQKHCFL